MIFRAWDAQQARGAKVRSELDVHGFHCILAGHSMQHASIEQVSAMPKQGITGVLRFGYAARAPR